MTRRPRLLAPFLLILFILAGCSSTGMTTNGDGGTTNGTTGSNESSIGSSWPTLPEPATMPGTPAKLPVPPVVYITTLSPQVGPNAASPDRPLLTGGRKASLRFHLGPSDDKEKLKPHPAITSSPVDVPLTVVLACTFCEGPFDGVQRMTYRPSQRQSDRVQFVFTPREVKNAARYKDELQLRVIDERSGQEFDRLIVAVEITQDIPAAGTAYEAPLQLRAARQFVDPAWKADVVLYVTQQSSTDVIVSLAPLSTAMKKWLGAMALHENGEPRTFRSGIDDAELVDAMATSAYGAMEAVSAQNQLADHLSASGDKPYISLKSRSNATSTLTPSESKNISKLLADHGRWLYRSLFYDSADKNLGPLIQKLEQAAAAAPKDRPLRMVIVTNTLSLPWQYLHPVGKQVDPNAFWGMRFSLSVIRATNGASDKPVIRNADNASKLLFARYGEDKDPSVKPATEQVSRLLALPMASEHLLRVASGRALLDEISNQRMSIDVIMMFLHASAGDGDTPPSLMFRAGDIVPARKFESLMDELEGEEQKQRYLARGPLVVLNACETGPARNLPHVKLQNAMFKLGAEGVVVTEVSVWVSLGHQMATRLIDHLAKGENISDAVTKARRELFAETSNPLGLLYAYYGKPEIKLDRAALTK